MGGIICRTRASSSLVAGDMFGGAVDELEPEDISAA